MLENFTLVQWAILGVTAFLYGFNKTGILGCAVVMTPLLLVFFPSGQMLGITLPILVVADIGTILMLKKSANVRHVLLALPWAFTGILIGWLFARFTVSLPDADGDRLLARAIAAILIFLIVFGVLVRFYPGIAARPEPADGAEAGRPLTRRWFPVTMGILGGISTMLANNGGPAWVVYLMSLGLTPREFLGTAAWLFFCQNLTKLPFAYSLGFLSGDTVLLALILIPAIWLGLWSGAKLVSRIPAATFNTLTQVATLAGALYILVM